MFSHDCFQNILQNYYCANHDTADHKDIVYEIHPIITQQSIHVFSDDFYQDIFKRHFSMKQYLH